MKDHVFRFDGVETAKATLAAYVSEDTWDGSRVLPDQRVIATDAVHDDDGEIVYTAPDADLELIATARIEPVWAGSRYVFGG